MQCHPEMVFVIVKLCLSAVSVGSWRRLDREEISLNQPMNHGQGGQGEHYQHKYKTYTANSNIPRDFHTPKLDIQDLVHENPVAATLLLSSLLHLPSKYSAPNHPELLPVNPFVALLLSQYGRYLPHHGGGRGLYGYAAANNYHNNKPFGSYKIYEDGEKR